MTSTLETNGAKTEIDTVLDAVRAAIPTLRANGPQAEADRWIPDQNLELLAKPGVFRMVVPKKYGGLDLPLPDIARVLSEIGRGCGSTSWVTSAYTNGGFLATFLPDKAQAEAFDGGEARISLSVTPSGAFTDADGGYRLNGGWAFASGCRGANWSLVPGGYQRADETWDQLLALVPTRELGIMDDWQVSAAAGTGSSTITAADVFVPAHRVITIDEMLHGGSGDRADGPYPGRSYSLISLVLVESASAIIGMARGTYDLFLERIPGRPISYTTWYDQTQHPLTQIQVGTAASKIAAAEALVERWGALLQERADAGAEPTTEEKIAVRGQCSYAIQLAKEAVEVLHSASGGSMIRSSSHLQRFHRDVLAFSLHALLHPNVGLEGYGRSLLGLEPSTPFL
ncbi:acyl-CoA dehydrogenase family protein [Nocardia sp. NBC_01499]|uniref:acyl-CoA dehydrogenase family protein n=1 Tax=Nocardia sp. NBC_01499 TaxID=2903597 RepID=UPI00386F95EB